MEIRLIIDGYDVTEYAEQITWSGDLQQVSRIVSAKLARGYRPDCGDKVKLYYNSDLIFRGMVMFVDIDPYTNSIECYDSGVYLANNSVYKEYNATAQGIAKTICSALGIKVGKLASKRSKTKVTASGSMSAFKAIEQAYEGKRKKAPQYSYSFDGENKFNVVKAGSVVINLILKDEIENPRRSKSIKGMTNKVVILNDKNKYESNVEDKSDRKKYGTFGTTYKKQKGKDAKTEAKSLLKGLEWTGSVSAVGDIRCMAGKGIYIEEPLTGLKGKQIIKSDKHTFTQGGHTMSLEFYYNE